MRRVTTSLFYVIYLWVISVFSIRSWKSYKPVCRPLRLPDPVQSSLKLSTLHEFCVTGAEFDSKRHSGNKRWQPPVIECECDPIIELAAGQYGITDEPEMTCKTRFNSLQHLPDAPNAYANDFLKKYPDLFNSRACHNLCLCQPRGFGLASSRDSSSVSQPSGSGASSQTMAQRQPSSGSARRTFTQRLRDSLRRISQRHGSGDSSTEGQRLLCGEGQQCSSRAECQRAAAAEPSCSANGGSSTSMEEMACVAVNRRRLGGTFSATMGFCMSVDTLSSDRQLNQRYQWPEKKLRKRGLDPEQYQIVEKGGRPQCLCNEMVVGEECCYASSSGGTVLQAGREEIPRNGTGY